MQITKASGLAEDFSEIKLLNSLKAVGISKDIGKETLRLVKDKLSSDTDTGKVHNIVSQYLGQHAHPLYQLNYNLKRAVFKLGPTGYPFEYFVAQILEEFKYHTKVGTVLKGKCVSHEVDIVAKKDNQIYYIECKFHNRPGLKTDIQAALYTQARFQDISNKHNTPNNNHYSWLITNTKATKDVGNYTKCQNMKLTSWGSPGKESLFNLIITSRIHPITALNSISKDQTQLLLKQNIVTLNDLTHLIKNNHLINYLSRDVVKKIKKEISSIYS